MEKQLELSPNDLPWHYKIRRSGRAKRIRLRYTASAGLELVLPRRAALAEGLAFVASQGEWIESLAARYQVDLKIATSAPAVPRFIELKATGEYYRVERSERMGLQEHSEFLALKASPDQAPLLLQQWMKHKARQVLLPWLADCSLRTGLKYARASVRNQSSRWGSYSSKGSVSLNCRLLLLPPAEVEYVLLHELCHSKHMDHSNEFWQLMQSVCPDAVALDHAVDEAAKKVPDWICYKPLGKQSSSIPISLPASPAGSS